MSDNPAVDFWQIVGEPCDFSDLEVGEVFLVKRAGGRIREVSRVVRWEGESFVCVRADPSELREAYKVMVLGDA